MAYRVLIFDLDGTLVDSFPAIHRSLAQAMEGVGLRPWDLETTARHVGHGVDYLLESAVGREHKDRGLELFRRHYSATCEQGTLPFPSVPETLQRLKAAGLELAVATNKPVEFSVRILEHLGLTPWFACILGPELVLHPKPHPDMINLIRERLGARAAACLYVGDMPLDAETATQAGVDCLLVATGAKARPELERQVQVPVVEEFSEILTFLKIPAAG